MIERQPIVKFKRTDRLNQQIKQEICDILRRKVSDPRLYSLTVTGVEVRSDLKSAIVKVCRMMTDPSHEPDAQDRKEVLQALKSARSFIFEHLRKRLEIRFIPDLIFEYDFSLAESSHLWGRMKHMTGAASE